MSVIKFKKNIRSRIEECEGLFGEKIAKKFDHQDRSLFFLRAPLLFKFIRSGITSGYILEVGCGPGILGLKLLKFSKNSFINLFGVDISKDMVQIAKKNAESHNLSLHTQFINATLEHLPFSDNFFDAIISNGSLHHWNRPQNVFLELARVLRPTGKIFINDLRRDASRIVVMILKSILTRWQRKHLDASFNAAYTIPECIVILKNCGLKGWYIRKNILEFEIHGSLYKE